MSADIETVKEMDRKFVHHFADKFGLTMREAEIVEQFIDDPESGYIMLARTLGIQERTLRSHCSNIMRKMNRTNMRSVILDAYKLMYRINYEDTAIFAVQVVDGQPQVERVVAHPYTEALWAVASGKIGYTDGNTALQLVNTIQRMHGDDSVVEENADCVPDTEGARGRSGNGS